VLFLLVLLLPWKKRHLRSCSCLQILARQLQAYGVWGVVDVFVKRSRNITVELKAFKTYLLAERRNAFKTFARNLGRPRCGCRASASQGSRCFDSEILSVSVSGYMGGAVLMLTYHDVPVFVVDIYQAWPNLLYVWAAYRKTQVTNRRNIKIWKYEFICNLRFCDIMILFWTTCKINTVRHNSYHSANLQYFCILQ